MVTPFPTAGLLWLLGRRLELKVHPASLPSNWLSTGGEENGPAPIPMTTPGFWQPPALALDVSGDGTMPESLTPRYCHPHGLFSLFSFPTVSRIPGGMGMGELGPLGPGLGGLWPQECGRPCREPRSGTLHCSP